MKTKPFTAARLKIQRAKRHVDELAKEIDEYLLRAPIYMKVTQNPSPEYLDWVQVCSEGVPPGLAPIVGDIVHNLRSSLDVLACELVRHNGQNDKGVYFPFSNSEAELESRIKEKNFDRAAPEVVDLLMALKPYKGGNAALRYIHDLNIEDKHRTLIPVAGYIKNPGGALGFNQEHLYPRTIGSGTILAQIAPDLVPNDKLPVTFNLVFPWRGPFEDRELVPTFHGLVQDFSGIVDAFEALCFGTITK